MIRIAFVIDTIEKPTAGTEKQLLLLLEHLDRTKFDPVLCILRPSKWIDEKFNLCPVYILGLESFKQFRIFLSIWRFVRFLKSNNISVVYSFFKEGVRIGAVAGKIAKVK